MTDYEGLANRLDVDAKTFIRDWDATIALQREAAAALRALSLENFNMGESLTRMNERAAKLEKDNEIHWKTRCALLRERDEALELLGKMRNIYQRAGRIVWRDIETVPNGVSVLVYWPPVHENDVKHEAYIGQAWRRFGHWFKTRDGYGAPTSEVNEPTRWMPLPALPPQVQK